MLKNNNNIQSYAKVRVNKNLSIHNSGSSTSSNGSNYLSTKDGWHQNNKNSSNSSRSSNSRAKEKNSKHNQSLQMFQEDNLNHLNHNIDFSSIDLKELKNQNKSVHNSSVYSIDNKENFSINYSNGVKNNPTLNQEQQETFRKIIQNREEKTGPNQQQKIQNQICIQDSSNQSYKQKQTSNLSQIKNIYQQIINSSGINQAFKNTKQQNSGQSQQKSLNDLSSRNDLETQKKRSESTYSNSNQSFESNQSICNLSSNRINNNNISVTSQINNWIAKSSNQIFKMDDSKSFVQDSSCISISQLLNNNNKNPNQKFNLSEQDSFSNSGVSKMINKQSQINESQDQIISNRINAQNQKINQQTQQQNLKQTNIVNNQNINKNKIGNNNQKSVQKMQINSDYSQNLHTFSSSQNNADIIQNNQFNISQDKTCFQSNQSMNNMLENLTIIQKQNEIGQLKKDLRQSNNEIIQYKNKIKSLEQENRIMKSQLDQEKQQKQHLEEYVQKIKGLQFILAQEKKIQYRIVQENYQRNENVSMVLINLVNIIKIIQHKIEQPKSQCQKILQKISDNLNPILFCLNPIIEDINSYNQQMLLQQQNQHESRYELQAQQFNKQASQKGKKVLTMKGVQQSQVGVQRNNSHNKLQSCQQNKNRCISVDEISGVQKQKRKIVKQEQNINQICRSHSSINVKQQQIQQKKQQSEEQFEFLQQNSQNLLKQSSSSINLQTQSIHIPQQEFFISDQNEDEIEEILAKQLLNNNNNPSQQIQLKQQQLTQQQQKNAAIMSQKKRNEFNNSKNQQNKNRIDSQKQQASLNDCQRINTKESMDSFYEQCQLNNSLKISESSRSFTTTNSLINMNQKIQQNNNIELLNIQIQNLNQQQTDKPQDNLDLQSGNIFSQLTQFSSNIGQNKQTSQTGGQFFENSYSQNDNNLLQNNFGNNHNHVTPPTQEFTGCFSTQNQPYLGTFSQIPNEGARFNIESNYLSDQSGQNIDQINIDLIQGRKSTNRNQNNVFKMSNFNSNSSQYNQSQKLFSDTLKGLGETLKNLKSDENSNEYVSEQNSQSSVSQYSKNTFRSNIDISDQQTNQQLKLSQNIENEEMSQLSEKLSQIGTEKSSTQLEIENLKQKIMQRQSRRKLQSCHNTYVQQEFSIISEKSQRDLSAPSKECKNDF